MYSYLGRIFALSVYFVLLHLAFKQFMLVKWVNDFLEVRWVTQPDVEAPLLISTLIATFLILLSATRHRRASDLFLLLVLLSPVLPMLVIFADRGAHINYIALVTLSYTIAFLIASIPITPVAPFRNIQWLRLEWIPWIVVFMMGIFIAANFATGGLSILNFNFSEVYQFRRLASDTRGVLMAYMLSNLIALFIALGCVIAYQQRRYIALLAILFGTVVIFGLTSQKSHVFVAVFALGLYRLAVSRKPFNNIVWTFTAVCGLTIALYALSESLHVFGTLTVRRVLFVPAYANFLYYDFFSTNAYVLWSDTKLTLGMIENPYGKPAPQVIGDFFSGKDFSNTVQRYNNANTGWLGAGYGHYGAVGMIFYAIVFGFVVRMTNVMALKSSVAIAVGGLSYAIFFTTNLSSDLTSSLLSHGLFAFMFIVAFLRFPQSKST